MNSSGFIFPRAVNVPFDGRIQRAVPNRGQAVVLYCSDAKCRASQQAAERMAALGYSAVYAYEAGKEDWHAAGLQIER